jgi:hypothetical protein
VDDSQKHGQHGDSISPPLFSKNNEGMLKAATFVNGEFDLLTEVTEEYRYHNNTRNTQGQRPITEEYTGV